MALTPTEEAQTRQLLAQQAPLLSLAGNEPVITSKLGATKVNLSQLPAATVLADADIALVRQGTTDKSVALSVLKTYSVGGAASETQAGIVELATAAETQTGTDNTRSVHPAGFKAAGSALWAALSGIASQVFNVGTATTASHATRYDQVFGLGQTWQDVTASRVVGTSYTNSSGKPIVVNHTGSHGTVNTYTVATINGVAVRGFGDLNTNGGSTSVFIIPPGATYVLSASSGTLTTVSWLEMR